MKQLCKILITLLFACSYANAQKSPSQLEETLSQSLPDESVKAAQASVSPQMLEVDGFDGPTVSALKSKIKELHDQNVEVVLRINTNGGSVFGQLELTQFIETQPVVCVVDYRALSAGAFFLESGACKERWATSRSIVLFHEALVMQTSGNSHALLDTVHELQAITNAIIATTSERLKMSKKEFQAKIDNKEWVMDADEALKSKVIDKIVKPEDLPPLTILEKPSLLELLLNGK